MQKVENIEETPAFAKHVLPAVPSSEVYLEDCVKALKRYADKHFDLAIVDPPYGINFSETIEKNTWNKRLKKKHSAKYWDKEIPNEDYFNELMRVSKNQIIWGGNYFLEFLPSTPCFLIWFKSQNFTGADCEMAWTSFKSPTRSLNLSRVVAHTSEIKIHPTQKNIKIYDWCLKNYAKPNDLILDTHLGSGSSRIAAYKGGFNFVGFEIDQEYYDKQEKRFNDFKSQLRLF